MKSKKKRENNTKYMRLWRSRDKKLSDMYRSNAYNKPGETFTKFRKRMNKKIKL